MADERIKLILNVSGVQDVTQLKQEIQDLAAALGVADTQFEKLDDTSDKTRDRLRKLRESADDAKGDGRGGRGISGLAYALQDFQAAGFSAVLNNVQQLATGLGLGAGVAGAAQIAGVAMVQFGSSILKALEPSNGLKDTQKELGTNMKKNQEIVDDLGKKIEELGKKARKTAEDFAVLAGKQADHKRMSEELKAMSAAEAAARDAENAKTPEEKADVDEMTGAGKTALTGKKFTDAQAAMAAEAGRKAEEQIKNDRMGSELERLQFWAKKAGVDVTGKTEAEIRRENASKFDVVDPETNRVISKGTEDDVTSAAKRVSMNNNEFQNARLAAARAKAEAESRRLLGIVTGGAKSPEEFMEAYNQLPPAVQAMILEQQTSAREKEFESQVGAPAAPGSLRGGSRQDFQRRMAAAKQDRADVQETFDREEADEVKRLAKVKEAEAAAKRAAKEAEDAAKKVAKEQEDAVKAEEQRVKLRDQVMARNGMTPEGLAVQRQNAGVGATAAANRNRAAMGNDQQRQMEAEFRRQGMTAKEAEKTTKEVMQAGDKMIAAMMKNGQVTLNRFKQLELTISGISRMMAEQAQGQVGMPGRQFNAGRR